MLDSRFSLAAFAALTILSLPLFSFGAKTPSKLRATALVTGDHNHTVLECWIFDAPFKVSSSPGTAGAASLSLAHVANATYTVLPPKFDGGLHNAPYMQFVVFLSGEAHVTLPHSDASAIIRGGKNGLIIANDITGTGHITKYPSDQPTVSLQIPFRPQNGKGIPAHKISKVDGPCKIEEQIIYA